MFHLKFIQPLAAPASESQSTGVMTAAPTGAAHSFSRRCGMRTAYHHVDINAVEKTMNHPFGNGLYNLFMVKLGMEHYTNLAIGFDLIGHNIPIASNC